MVAPVKKTCLLHSPEAFAVVSPEPYGLEIDTLEARGLIERRADPADRRAWLIALRPDGVRLTEPIMKIDETLRAELREGISRPERQRLAGLLERLRVNLTGVLEENDN